MCAFDPLRTLGRAVVSIEMRHRSFVLCVALAMAPAPALACDTGPFAVGFVGSSATLKSDRQGLDVTAEYFSGPNKHHLVKWYGGKADRLAQSRAKAVTDYLVTRGVPRSRVKIIHGGIRRPINSDGRSTVQAAVTVETVEGC